MIYLSASAIKDFLSCSKKYYYRRYHKSLAKPSNALIAGTIVHNAIEKYWFSYKLARGEALKEYRATKLPASVGDTILANVGRYFEHFSWMCSEDDVVEENFSIPYADDVKLIGKFDRVTVDGKILDWKTNKNMPSQLTVQSDPQFILYNWAYKELRGVRPTATYFASLFFGKLVPYVVNPVLEDILIDEVIPDVVTAIRKDRFRPTGFLHYNKEPCRFCSYKEACHNELVSRNSLAESRRD